MTAEEPAPHERKRERTWRAPGSAQARSPGQRAHSAARGAHGAGRGGVAGGHPHAARADHRHGAADPSDLRRRLARLAVRHRDRRALRALLRAHLRRHHARPHRRRSGAGARSSSRSACRSASPSPTCSSARSARAPGRWASSPVSPCSPPRSWAAARCSRRRRARRPCWWPRSSRPRGSTSPARSTPWWEAPRRSLVGALLLPIDPVRLVREGLGPVLDRLAAVLGLDRRRARAPRRRATPSARWPRSAGSTPSTTTSPRRSPRPATPRASR